MNLQSYQELMFIESLDSQQFKAFICLTSQNIQYPIAVFKTKMQKNEKLSKIYF